MTEVFITLTVDELKILCDLVALEAKYAMRENQYEEPMPDCETGLYDPEDYPYVWLVPTYKREDLKDLLSKIQEAYELGKFGTKENEEDFDALD